MDKTNLTFDYTNTAADISAFHVYSFRGSPHFKRNILNGRMFILVYVIVAVLYAALRIAHSNDDSIKFDMWLLICSMVIIGILWYFLFPQFYRKSVKEEAFAKQKHGRLKTPITRITLADGQLAAERDGQNVIINAENVVSVVMETNYIYIILPNEDDSLIIPHSAMNEQQRTELETFLTDTFSDKIIRIGGESR